MVKEKASISGPLHRTASSFFSPRPEFSTDNFSDPRPPEEADMIAEMAQSQLLDVTSVHDNDPATTDLLMQLFLSDITPEEELNKLGCGLGVASSTTTTPPTMLDVDREPSVISTASSPTSSLATVPQLPSPNPLTDSGICSEAPSPSPVPGPTSHVQQPHNGNTTICNDVISVLMSSASPLECTDSNGFSDPLDNPFLTESTDLSDFLQDPCISTMLSSTTHTPPSSTNTVCNNDSDTTPFPLSVMSEFDLSQSPIGSNTHSNTDVHVNMHNSDLNLFDLSQNASLLPPSFDATEVENLDIDFSAFCADTFSLLPTSTSSDDNVTSEQLSIMLTQAQQTTSTSSTVDLGPPSVSNSNCDDVFIESSPSPSATSDQLSVTELSVKSPEAAKSRKRSASDLDSDTGDSAPDAKKTKPTRREKNNVASQISRAKRKAKNTAMFDRVGELESENAMLRIKEKELTDEIERLKKLLVHRLSQ